MNDKCRVVTLIGLLAISLSGCTRSESPPIPARTPPANSNNGAASNNEIATDLKMFLADIQSLPNIALGTISSHSIVNSPAIPSRPTGREEMGFVTHGQQLRGRSYGNLRFDFRLVNGTSRFQKGQKVFFAWRHGDKRMVHVQAMVPWSTSAERKIKKTIEASAGNK